MNPTSITANKHIRYPGRVVPILVVCACLVGLFLMFCVVAGAATYDSGSGISNINSGNSSYWSTVLSNNVSTLTDYTDINIQDGAGLNLINATINMGYGSDINVGTTIGGVLELSDSTINMKYANINVKNGSTMNITDGSTITHLSSYYYYLNYNSGSFGYINDSTVEYGRRLEISTPNLKITSSNIRNNLYEGISLTSTSGNINITNNTITNNGYEGIKIVSSGNINISNNIITDNGGTTYAGIDIASSDNNILINNTIEDNGVAGIDIGTSDNNILRDNIITNNGAIGINIVSSGNNFLRDNYINGTSRGLYVTGNYTNDIDTSNRVNGGLVYYRNNNDSVSIVGDDNVGHITLNACSNISVKDNTFVSDGDGIRLLSSTENITIDNNIFSNSNYFGIDLASSRANISNNIVTSSDQTAISLSTSDNCNLTHNIVSSVSDSASGIKLVSSDYNNLTNNTVTGTNNNMDGILISGSSNNDLIDNIVMYSGGINGIKLSSSNYNNLTNNSLKNKNQAGLFLSSSSYNTIRNNDVTDNDWGGITIEASSYNNISNNVVLSNGIGGVQFDVEKSGLNMISGSNNLIDSNNISLNKLNGIMVSSAGNTISNNTITNNDDNGIYIEFDGSTFSNNAITVESDAGYGFDIRFGQYDNYIYQNNTVNGEKIYYFFNDNTVQTVTVEPLTKAKVSNVGKISLIKCSNFEIKDNVLSNNIYIDGGFPSGILLYNSTDNTISNNIITNNNRGVFFYNSSNNIINDSNRINASEDRGIYFNTSNYNDITNNILGLNIISGIYFYFSDYNNITDNYITGSPEGILFNTSLYNNLFTNDIINYTFSAIHLIEYSLNNTMIGNVHSIRNSAEFDIHINDSNNNIIAPNQTTAANYTFYLTGDTRLVTLDTVFNKSKVGYEDTSELTLMWRIDVFSWDNKHLEPIWGNLTLSYGDFSDVGGMLIWEGSVSNGNGRMSGNSVDFWGPPDSADNWVPIIEYKQNATGRIDYAHTTPMNATVINKWDELQGIDKPYRNITSDIDGPGITIIVNAGYTPNGRCYFCHMEKLTYTTMLHWTEYSVALEAGGLDEYTPPGRCIDCHDYNDAITVPHGVSAGKDMLIQQSPQLCYNGNGSQNCHNTVFVNPAHDQEAQFSQMTHHNLSEGKMTCFSCHDNHGTEYDYDLHRYYKTTTTSTYNTDNYKLCFICHLEEKFKARPVGETDTYLQGYTNQTNFRDDYYKNRVIDGFGNEEPRVQTPRNLHGDPNYGYGPHRSYTCSYCHQPHGSDNPATTRPGLDWTYITNLVAPGGLYLGNWTEQTELVDQGNWSNSTLNQGAGFGSGENACGSHSSSQNLPSMFISREYIDYESAGGPDCVGCHNSSDPDAIRKILNVSALKLAMHTNLSLDFRNGGDLQGTGMNWTEWGENRSYDASNISTDNAICWSCHSTSGIPPYPGFHPDRTLAPYRCPKCHGPIAGQPSHTAGLVAAIDNHGPTTKGGGSVFIQTNVGTNGSCPDCHASSRLPDSMIGPLTVWKWGTSYPADGFVPFTGRTTNGDVSHYGLSRSQGEELGIANPLVNTSNCLFCHTNSTNGAIWGNAINVSGNMYGADTTNVSECYSYCHVLPDFVDIINESSVPHFHNRSVYSGGGPNCVDCHDVNSIYQVQSLVNATSIAQGIHGNMGNNTIELISGIDPRSKPCWGCHNSDGHEPEGMGDRNGIYDPDIKPWTCEDCHGRSTEWVAATGDGESWLAASYPPNKLPPRVYAHYPNSSTVKTSVNGVGGCVDCHVNSIDPYRNDTAEMVLGNTIFSNVSHYGLNRSQGVVLGITNPLFDTSNCGICHNSTGNATIWGGATQNNHGNFTNYSAEDGCYSCHTTDGQIPVDFHAENVSSGVAGPDCLDCHSSTGNSKLINSTLFNNSVHVNLNSEAINSTILNYNSSKACWLCHGNGTQPDTHLSNLTEVRTCYDDVYCHGNITLNQNVSVQEHFINGTDIQATNATTNVSSCIQCHNLTDMKVTGAPTDKNGTYLVSHYAKNYTEISSLRSDINSTDYCLACHGNTNSIFYNASIITKTTTHGNNCSSCHNAGNIHDSEITRYSGGDAIADCLDCHSDTANNKFINATIFTQSVHSNLNSEATNSTVLIYNSSKACWSCHGNGTQPTTHLTNLTEVRTCYDNTYCHGNTTLNMNVSVEEHFINGTDIQATNTADNVSSCIQCHNLTDMKVTGAPTGGNGTYQVSHYAKNYTEISSLRNNINSTDYCLACHGNTNSIFYNASIITKTTNHGNNCSSCHGAGKIHDANLSSYSGDGIADCLDCHSDTANNKFVNLTLFTQSVHINLNSEATNTTVLNFNSSKACWSCHGNGTQPTTHLTNLTEVRTCYDNTYCHGNTTLNMNVSVEEHFLSGDNIKALTDEANNTDSCIACHNKTEMKVSGAPIDSSGLYSVSHFAKNYTTISSLRNTTNTTDYCTACHFNDTSIFKSFINTSGEHGTDCASCHGIGKIHDASLEIPSMSGNTSKCLSCHDDLSNKSVSSNEYTESVHALVNCVDCHTPRQEFKGIIVNQESLRYNFTMIPDITSLNATLGWEGGSTLGLTLHSPDGTNYSGNSINISSPQKGNWSAVIQDIIGDASFTVTINVTMDHGILMAKECNECHVTGFSTTPIVYKHLPQQSDVPTDASCILCHESKLSSATAMGTSHYAPRVTLDTKDCIQCHNGSAEGWGNAPDQRNHTDFAFVTKTLSVDKPWELVDNYTITLIETTNNAAMIDIKKDGMLLERNIAGLGDNIKYEISGLGIDDTAIINITIDQLFTAAGSYVVDLSGYMLSSHIHRETQNEQCYSCHDSDYRKNMPDGMDYYVLDKDLENVTLMAMPVNFTGSDKKTIAMGESWDIGEGYSIHVVDVSIERSNARLQLYRNETLLEDEIVSANNYITHEETLLDRDIDVFSAKVDGVFVGVSKFVVLTNVDLISGDQKIINGDVKLLQTAISAKYLTLDESINVGEEPENFHAATITPGGYSPDCISCHTGDGVAPIKLDLDEFKQGVHVNLNNDTTYTSFITDDTNKACWGCHGNSTGGEPDEHPTPYLGNHTPKSCITCHGNSLFGAKQIYSHYQGAEISTNGTCWDCHSNNQNNSKPQNAAAAASHYSAKKNLLNTSDCAVCHGNETNATLWGNAPMVSKHNSSNDCALCHAGEDITTFHDKGITITRNCEDCHVDKQQAEKLNLTPILTHYPDAPDGKANTLENNDYTCRVCHNATNNSLHSDMEVREYQNETMGFCFPCHSVEGKFPHKSDTQLEKVRHGSGIKVVAGCDSCHATEGVSKYHSPTALGKSYMRGTVKYDTECTECHSEHEGREYQPYEGIKCEDCHNEYGSVHYAGLKIGQSNATTSTCPLCHNEEADTFHELTHIVGNVSEEAYEPCGDCHDDIDALMEYSSSTSIIGGTMSTITQSTSNESLITCTSCHNSSGMNSFHYDAYPMGTVQDPGWENWTAGNVTECKDCHTYQGGEPPFNATNMGTQGRSPAGTAHGFAPSCTICHGGADSISFHTLATSEFIPRLGVTIEPNVVSSGDISLLRATVVLPQLTKLTRAEYFIDDMGRDGYGLKLEYIVGESSDSSAVLGAVMDTSDLSYGKHPIFVHVKDSSGKWSKIEVVVLTVERPGGVAVIEVIFKDIIPAFSFAVLLYLIWRRFR